PAPPCSACSYGPLCLLVHGLSSCKHNKNVASINACMLSCKHMANPDEDPQKTEPKGRAKGGIARANALSATERAEIARKGAAARWDKPQATHEGQFHIGDATIACAV